MFQNLFLLKKFDFHWKIAFSEVKIYKMILNVNPKTQNLFGSNNILKLLQENPKRLWSVICLLAIMELKVALKCDILSENTIFDWKYLQNGN